MKEFAPKSCLKQQQFGWKSCKTTEGERYYEKFDDRDSVSVAVLSPDGTKLLVGHDDGSACLVDTQTGNKLAEFPKTLGAITAVAYSPDGNTLIVGRKGGRVFFYDGTGQALKERRFYATRQALDSYLYFITSNTDGTLIFVAMTNGIYACFGLASENRKSELKWRYQETEAPKKECKLYSAVFSPDGKTIITAFTDGKTYAWDVATGTPQPFFEKGFLDTTSVLLSTDITTIFIATTTRGIYFAHKKENGYEMPGAYNTHNFNHENGIFTAVSALFSKDKEVIVAGTAEGLLRMYSCKNGVLLAQGEVPQGEKFITLVGLSDDKKTLFVQTRKASDTRGNKSYFRGIVSIYSIGEPSSIVSTTNTLSITHRNSEKSISNDCTVQ